MTDESTEFAPWDTLGHPGSTLATTPAGSRRGDVEVVGPQGPVARIVRGLERRTDDVRSAGVTWVLARGRGGSMSVRDAATGQTVAAVDGRGWGTGRNGVVAGLTVRWKSAGMLSTRWTWLDEGGAVLLEVQPRGFLHLHLEFTVGAARVPADAVLLLVALSRHLVWDADEQST